MMMTVKDSDTLSMDEKVTELRPTPSKDNIDSSSKNTESFYKEDEVPMNEGDFDQTLDEKIHKIVVQREVEYDKLWERVKNYPNWPPSLPPLSNSTLHDRVFTHKSTLNRDDRSNYITGSYERMEFLGDSYVNHFVSRMLFVMCPFLNEGGLTNLRSELISNKFLRRFGLIYGFEDKLSSMAGEYKSNTLLLNPKVLADMFEAYIGAIITDTDNGYAIADQWLKELYVPFVCEFKSIERLNGIMVGDKKRRGSKSSSQDDTEEDNFIGSGQIENSCNLLNALAVKIFGADGIPKYTVEPTGVPDCLNSESAWRASCTLINGWSGIAEGARKQAAKQRAAYIVLKKLKLSGVNVQNDVKKPKSKKKKSN